MGKKMAASVLFQMLNNLENISSVFIVVRWDIRPNFVGNNGEKKKTTKGLLSKISLGRNK
jgi:hypothetical protein